MYDIIHRRLESNDETTRAESALALVSLRYIYICSHSLALYDSVEVISFEKFKNSPLIA